MISAFNRRQVFKSLGHLLLAPFGFLVTWIFFYWAVPSIAAWFIDEKSLPSWLGPTSAWVFVVLLSYSAWQRHASEKAAFELESGMFWTNEPEGGGGAVMQWRVNQWAGSVWLLAGLFISGPLSLFRAVSAWKLRLPNDPKLEDRMEALLQELRTQNKWLAAGLFSGQWKEMTALIRVGAVDFSALKGRVKAAY
jgi:hypothetical protein